MGDSKSGLIPVSINSFETSKMKSISFNQAFLSFDTSKLANNEINANAGLFVLSILKSNAFDLVFVNFNTSKIQGIKLNIEMPTFSILDYIKGDSQSGYFNVNFAFFNTSLNGQTFQASLAAFLNTNLTATLINASISSFSVLDYIKGDSQSGFISVANPAFSIDSLKSLVCQASVNLMANGSMLSCPPPITILGAFELLGCNSLTIQSFFDLFVNNQIFGETLNIGNVDLFFSKDKASFLKHNAAASAVKTLNKPVTFEMVLRLFIRNDNDSDKALLMIKRGEIMLSDFKREFDNETALMIAALLSYQGLDFFEHSIKSKHLETKTLDRAIVSLLELGRMQKLEVLKQIDFPIIDLVETLPFHIKQLIKGNLEL